MILKTVVTAKGFIIISLRIQNTRNDYVCAVLPSRIKEALTMDDRIEDVTDFDISVKKKNVFAKFTVVTADEDLEIETEVNINV